MYVGACGGPGAQPDAPQHSCLGWALFTEPQRPAPCTLRTSRHSNGYAHRDLKLENAVVIRATRALKVGRLGGG